MKFLLTVYFDKNCDYTVRSEVRNILSELFRNVEKEYRSFNLLIDSAFDQVRKQYDAGSIFHMLSGMTQKGFFLGIVSEDIFVDDLNFVFGVAYPWKGAVISTYRLALTEIEGKFRERLLKTIKHELGHIFGLKHCNKNCVMRFANSLYELDMKAKDYCDDCISALRKLGLI